MTVTSGARGWGTPRCHSPTGERLRWPSARQWKQGSFEHTQITAEPGHSDETIRKGSGKTWAEWVEFFDTWGAVNRPHKVIAQHVCDQGVDGWWAQAVTVGYERIKGLRGHG